MVPRSYPGSSAQKNTPLLSPLPPFEAEAEKEEEAKGVNHPILGYSFNRFSHVRAPPPALWSAPAERSGDGALAECNLQHYDLEGRTLRILFLAFFGLLE